MMTRDEAAQACVSVLDEKFFRAFAESARVTIFREVVLLGEADIAAIAERLPQDRSVISRHLQLLADAGILTAAKRGRQVFYRVDGTQIADKLEAILGIVRALQPHCCPAEGAAT
jgi:ArsR family transcriptional regulator, zinc-responsive transcriptional repressor